MLAMPFQTVRITLARENAHLCDFGESLAAVSLRDGGFVQMSLLAGKRNLGLSVSFLFLMIHFAFLSSSFSRLFF